MLALTLAPGERVQVGDNVWITILRKSAQGGKVRIGFEAPQEVPIVREGAKEKTPRRRQPSKATVAPLAPVMEEPQCQPA